MVADLTPDAVRRTHSVWFHFTKEPRYFSGIDEIREAEGRAPRLNGDRDRLGGEVWNSEEAVGQTGSGRFASSAYLPNPLGRLPGSAWRIPSQPLLIPDDTRQALDLSDHFAAFPQEWPRRIITGWSPIGICTVCGEGRRPVVEASHYDVSRPQYRRALELVEQHGLTAEHVEAVRAVGVIDSDAGQIRSGGTWTSESGRLAAEAKAVLGGYYRELCGSGAASLTGYACACPTPDAPTTPAVVLDPFGGTGTVAGVARTLGRYGISNDLSESYNRLAIWRITQSGHFTKTEQRAWADRQGQLL